MYHDEDAFAIQNGGKIQRIGDLWYKETRAQQWTLEILVTYRENFWSQHKTSKKYIMWTIDVINIFPSMCARRQRKKSEMGKGLILKPILHKEMNSWCQMALTDMRVQVDMGLKFIIVYQDHLTKFVLLRAL